MDRSTHANRASRAIEYRNAHIPTDLSSSPTRRDGPQHNASIVEIGELPHQFIPSVHVGHRYLYNLACVTVRRAAIAAAVKPKDDHPLQAQRVAFDLLHCQLGRSSPRVKSTWPCFTKLEMIHYCLAGRWPSLRHKERPTLPITPLSWICNNHLVQPYASGHHTVQHRWASHPSNHKARLLTL